HLLVIPTDELYCPGRDSLPDQLPPLQIFTNNFLPDTRCGMKIDWSGRLKQLSERVSHQIRGYETEIEKKTLHGIESFACLLQHLITTTQPGPCCGIVLMERSLCC